MINCASTERGVTDPLSAALRIEADTRATRNRTRLRMGTSVGAEDRFDGLAEQSGNREGQRKTGIVFAGLDRVHRLARDVESLREIGLGPLPLRPEHTESVDHRYLRRTINWPMDQPRNSRSQSQCQESAIPVFGTTSNFASSPYAITTIPVNPN